MGKKRWLACVLAALPATGAGCATTGKPRSTGEVVMGNVFGAPLGLVGFAVMQPICIPVDLFIAVPAALKRDREWKEVVLACHTGLMGLGYCAGYDAGSYAFREGRAGGPCH